jgi:hypothetical protein
VRYIANEPEGQKSTLSNKLGQNDQKTGMKGRTNRAQNRQTFRAQYPLFLSTIQDIRCESAAPMATKYHVLQNVQTEHKTTNSKNGFSK